MTLLFITTQTMLQNARQALENINIEDLNVNQAFLNITSYRSDQLWMYTLLEDCIRCPFTRTRVIEAMNQYLIRFDASRSLTWKFFDEDHGRYAFDSVKPPICTINPTDLGPRGVYNIDINEDWCSFDVKLSPTNYHLSLLYGLLILAAILFVIYTSNYIYRRYKRSFPLWSGANSDGELEKPIPTKTRLRSLDAFRGTAIVLMIFVNSGGGSYWWMEHATWNGLYVADLVFPWFIWIMGVCIPISIKSQMSRNVSKMKIISSIFIRAIKLFFIGFCLNSSWAPFEEIRIMGVLQRFGVSYFVVATIHALFYIKPNNIFSHWWSGKLKRALYDIYIIAFQWFAILCLTFVYLILIFGLTVPGCPRGYLGPGGKQDGAAHMDCIGGATGYIDQTILGQKHIYQWPTAGSVYDSKAFDPEGIVGCITSFLQVFIGLQCGITLMVFTEWKSRLIRLLIWSAVLGILGGGLCLFSQEGGVIPINKNLWSLSFVFATSALAYLLLTFFYIIIDVLNWWSGTPLVYAGMNSIMLYVGHEVLGMFPWRWSIGPMNTHLVLLVENMWHAGMWVVVSYYFYCKKWFISV